MLLWARLQRIKLTYQTLSNTKKVESVMRSRTTEKQRYHIAVKTAEKQRKPFDTFQHIKKDV
jgi:hypothetical protein